MLLFIIVVVVVLLPSLLARGFIECEAKRGVDIRNKERLTKDQSSQPGESPGSTILKILYNSVYLQTENARSKTTDCTIK